MNNKVIMCGGLSSKNSPNYTEEAFLLAKKKDDVDGIHVNVYTTGDEILVLSCENTCMRMGIDKEYIENHSYKHIANINSGTKVKTNKLLTLDRLLSIIGNEMIVLINVMTSCLDNDLIIGKLLGLLNKYPQINYYITAEDNDFLEKVNDSINNVHIKIGNFINTKDDFYYAYDFCIINDNTINHYIDLHNVETNKVFFYMTKKNNILEEITNINYIYI